MRNKCKLFLSTFHANSEPNLGLVVANETGSLLNVSPLKRTSIKTFEFFASSTASEIEKFLPSFIATHNKYLLFSIFPFNYLHTFNLFASTNDMITNKPDTK